LLGLLARRRAGSGQQRPEPGGELVEAGGERAFQVHVAPGPREVADGVGEVVREDPPQPGRALLRRVFLPAVHRLVRLQERLLDHVGRIELGAQPRVQVQAGQEPQVIAVRLQQLFARRRHRSPSPTRCTVRSWNERAKKNRNQFTTDAEPNPLVPQFRAAAADRPGNRHRRALGKAGCLPVVNSYFTIT
jgi:hypothetical protein